MKKQTEMLLHQITGFFIAKDCSSLEELLDQAGAKVEEVFEIFYYYNNFFINEKESIKSFLDNKFSIIKLNELKKLENKIINIKNKDINSNNELINILKYKIYKKKIELESIKKNKLCKIKKKKK